MKIFKVKDRVSQGSEDVGPRDSGPAILDPKRLGLGRRRFSNVKSGLLGVSWPLRCGLLVGNSAPLVLVRASVSESMAASVSLLAVCT